MMNGWWGVLGQHPTTTSMFAWDGRKKERSGVLYPKTNTQTNTQHIPACKNKGASSFLVACSLPFFLSPPPISQIHSPFVPDQPWPDK